jgi:hypothetical protein
LPYAVKTLDILNCTHAGPKGAKFEYISRTK